MREVICSLDANWRAFPMHTEKMHSLGAVQVCFIPSFAPRSIVICAQRLSFLRQIARRYHCKTEIQFCALEKRDGNTMECTFPEQVQFFYFSFNWNVKWEMFRSLFGGWIHKNFLHQCSPKGYGKSSASVCVSGTKMCATEMMLVNGRGIWVSKS